MRACYRTQAPIALTRTRTLRVSKHRRMHMHKRTLSDQGTPPTLMATLISLWQLRRSALTLAKSARTVYQSRTLL